MATQDNNSPGLLSKVAKFVRNPTTDWADLDKLEPKAKLRVEPQPQLEPDPETSTVYSRETLKSMLERKRHDDAIRKREFDHLRKLRRSAPAITSDMVAKNSFLRDTTGYSDLDDRAMTLRKIDEIEAQMSKQWWKGHAKPGTAESARQAEPGARLTAQAKLDTHMGFASTIINEDMADGHDMPTVMGSTTQDYTVAETQPNRQSSFTSPANAAGFDSKNFESSKLFAVEMGDALLDPELEEAAIRFANSDDTGAEAVLLTAYQASDANEAAAQTWMAALFDLYRCTGQHNSFENQAVNYAQRFGRSAPQWFSVPEQLQLNPDLADSGPTSVQSDAAQVVWPCPAKFDIQAVNQLASTMASTSKLRSVNWSDLEHITPQAAQALGHLLAQWAEQMCTIHFEGVGTLDRLLRSATPVASAQVEKFWWQLRLDLLRILNQQDDFELVALDYCITYEVSPPPWRDVRCQRIDQLPAQAVTQQPLQSGGLLATTDEWRTSSGFARSVLLEPVNMPLMEVQLRGELQGDTVQALLPQEKKIPTGSRLVVTCATLIRVDFSAAGSILNWVAQCESLGCQVEFQQVPHLVAAFFTLIGINEHAKILTRVD